MPKPAPKPMEKQPTKNRITVHILFAFGNTIVGNIESCAIGGSGSTLVVRDLVLPLPNRICSLDDIYFTEIFYLSNIDTS